MRSLTVAPLDDAAGSPRETDEAYLARTGKLYLRVGFPAAIASNVVFAVLRFIAEFRTGGHTGYWNNIVGALGILAIYWVLENGSDGGAWPRISASRWWASIS